MIARHIAALSQGMATIRPEGGDIVGFTTFDDGGVECEVGELLYGLVRAFKPRHILETGTRLGHAAAYMALALRDNGGGKLTTIEINGSYTQDARVLLGNLGASDYAECITGDACQYTPAEPLDMILLDTELQFRFDDAVRLWPWLRPGGLLVIHDLCPGMAQVGRGSGGAYGPMPDEMRRWIAEHELQSIHFNTPRGLYVGQRAAPGFYSTQILGAI